MYNGLLMAHSGWRYIVLLALLVAIVKYLIGWLGNGKWSNFDSTLNRITPITIDIQWLLGLILWISQTWWNDGDAARAWEHPVTMTLAVVAVHILSARVKRADTDNAKYRAAFVAYIVTFAVIALGLFVILGGWNLLARP